MQHVKRDILKCEHEGQALYLRSISGGASRGRAAVEPEFLGAARQMHLEPQSLAGWAPPCGRNPFRGVKTHLLLNLQRPSLGSLEIDSHTRGIAQHLPPVKIRSKLAPLPAEQERDRAETPTVVVIGPTDVRSPPAPGVPTLPGLFAAQVQESFFVRYLRRQFDS
jgi:hypothetical protein